MVGKVMSKCKACECEFMPKYARYNQYCSRKCARKVTAAREKIETAARKFGRQIVAISKRIRRCQQCGMTFYSLYFRPTCMVCKAVKHKVLFEAIKHVCVRCERVYVLHLTPGYRLLNPLRRVRDTNHLTHCQRCRKHLRKKASPIEKLRHKRLNAKRRAVLRGAVTESFDANEVFERDGWRCQLCNRKVLRVWKGYHPRAATLDHIIPLACNGNHVRANVQCACMMCNSKKSSTPRGQTRMFG